jgi:pre-mRNA-splicing factor ATP-dependent RNA helicase DHX38/PRP16
MNVGGGLHLSSSSTSSSTTTTAKSSMDEERGVVWSARKRKSEWDAARLEKEKREKMQEMQQVRSSSDWAAETPRVPSGSYYADSYMERPSVSGPPGSSTMKNLSSDFADWDQEQQRLDREWYNLEEGGTLDETHNAFTDLDGYYRAKEERVKEQAQIQKKVSVRALQMSHDNDLWETNRMLTSGIAQRRELDLDLDETDEGRVHVLLRDLKPPFLDGNMIFTKQLDMVQSVRDPTSDMAVFSRAGSKLVREKRDQRERAKATKASLEMAGTALGNIMGVTEEDEEQKGISFFCSSNCIADSHQHIHTAKQEEKEAADYKGESQFSSHLKEKSDAVSNFARTKTVKEQRQYLPAFAVREELLQIIRDNNGSLFFCSAFATSYLHTVLQQLLSSLEKQAQEKQLSSLNFSWRTGTGTMERLVALSRVVLPPCPLPSG